MSKKYSVKPTKTQLAFMRMYWKMLEMELTSFYARVAKIEELMRKDTGISDIEFFESDTGFCGIGNISRTMKLINDVELEKN